MKSICISKSFGKKAGSAILQEAVQLLLSDAFRSCLSRVSVTKLEAAKRQTGSTFFCTMRHWVPSYPSIALGRFQWRSQRGSAGNSIPMLGTPG